jgi:hypothetical protein
MKIKKTYIIAAILLAVLTKDCYSQSRIWSLLPYKVEFGPTLNNPPQSPTVSDISVAQTNYSYVHNLIYNPDNINGDISFYTNGTDIFDYGGGNYPGFNLSNYNEISIIPYENSTGKEEYLVLTPLEYQRISICSDFENEHLNQIGSGLLHGTNGLGGFRSVDGYPKTNLISTSTEFIVDEIEGPIRIVFVCNMSEDQGNFNLFLNLFKVTNDGQITFLKAYDKNDLNISNNAYIPAGVINDVVCNISTEMELINITHNNEEKFRLAFSYNDYNDLGTYDGFVIHAIEFNKSDFSDINTLTFSDNKIYELNPCYSQDDVSVVHGLEFSPDGENLFYNYTGSCINYGSGISNPCSGVELYHQ